VAAAGAGLENGRGEAVTNAQGVQIWDEVAGISEGEVAVELEAVDRRRDPTRFQGILEDGVGEVCGRADLAEGDANAQLLAQGKESFEPTPGVLIAALRPRPQLRAGGLCQLTIEFLGAAGAPLATRAGQNGPRTSVVLRANVGKQVGGLLAVAQFIARHNQAQAHAIAN
jgi:hypothetical protein